MSGVRFPPPLIQKTQIVLRFLLLFYQKRYTIFQNQVKEVHWGYIESF